MKIKAIFHERVCTIEIVPENAWEKRLLGAVAGKTGMLAAQVEYKTEGHFSHEMAEVVLVRLTSTANT
jgi:hypothetical protein